jgi:ribosomal protein L7Ae-like RNA K-turn-binding protein
MADRALGFVGLAARAGALAVGTSATRAALQNGAIAVVVVAADRSARTKEKVERLARGAGIPTLIGPSAVVLGARIGRGAVQAVGITDDALARGLVGAASGDGAGGVS